MEGENPLGDWIKREMVHRQWTLRNVALKADLGPPTVFRTLHGKTRPTPETLEKLATAFRVDPDLLFQLAGYKRPATGSAPSPWPTLT